MNERRKKRIEKMKAFSSYCKKVWFYLEAEMMVPAPKSCVDHQDIFFYYKAGNDVQTAAFLIKEMLPD
jgi:hypothetical protein